MITQAVGALFNACWQGLALVAVTSMALRFFPRSSASTRYAVWFAALIAVAALPAIDFGLARASVTQPIAVPSPVHFNVVQTGTVTYPRATEHAAVSRASAVTLPTTTIGYAVEAAPDRLAQIRTLAAGIAASIGAALSRVAVPLLLTWIGFTAVMLYRLVIAYVRLRRVKRGLVPMDDAMVDHLIANSARPVVVGIATDLTMPCVLGFARPAIALPATLAAELTTDDLQRIVRHEHAHVRRWDDVANAMQLVVQAIMCLNPAVHLIGRSLNVEREIACDDFAVEPLAERVQYAKCLTHIAVNGFGRGRALPAPGFFFNRKQLLVRVERLLEHGHNGSTTIGTTVRYALVGLAIVAIAVARVQLPVIAATPLPAHSVPGVASHVSPVSNANAIDHVGPTQIHVGPDQSHVGPTLVGGQARHEHQLARLALPVARALKPAAVDLHVGVKAMLGTPIQSVEHSMTELHLKLKQKTFMHAFTNMVASAAAGGSTAPVAPAAPAAPTSNAVPAIAPAAFKSRSGSSGGDFLDALASAGYKNLSVDDLVQLKNVGVDGELIDAAVRYSGSRPSVESLVRMASVGVDGDFLNRLQSSGYPRISLEDVIRMRSIGVDPEYIREMNAALHSKSSIEQLTQMRALGVDADYVRSFAKLGYDKLSPNDLVRLRAVGVDASYVRMLRSKGIGGSGLSVDDLIRMKSVGVE
ncbi:MAG TPA: M56 family metallopeptidase [Candidatus Eremiobacteraceae bacterium]